MMNFGILSSLAAIRFLKDNPEFKFMSNPGVYLDTKPILQNLNRMGFPNHIKEAIAKAFQKPDMNVSKEKMNAMFQRLGTIISNYEKKNPGLIAPWAAPDHPINYNPMAIRNYGVFRGGNILY